MSSFAAMCHYGIAYNYGLNINRGVDAEHVPAAVYHAKMARAYSRKIIDYPILVGLTDAMYVDLLEK